MKTPACMMFLGIALAYAPNGVCGVPEKKADSSVKQLVSGSRRTDGLPAVRPTRAASSAFPVENLRFPVRTQLDIADGVIVANDSADNDCSAMLQKMFRDKWQLDLPVMSAEEARRQKRSVILSGPGSGNSLSRMLSERMTLVNPVKGYELRSLLNYAGSGGDALCFIGRDAQEVKKAADDFFRRYPKRGNLFGLSFCSTQYRLDDPEKMADNMRSHYRNPPDYIPNQSAIRLLRNAVYGFQRNGDTRYGKAFGDMIRIILSNYDRALDLRKTPPSFTFHEFPWMAEIMANTSSFTADDRRDAVRMMLKAVENMLGYWEMTTPVALYEAGKTKYLTNHYIFASRSVFFTAEYLRNHHEYPPADYWMAVCRNAFAGVANSPVSPEDSANYQFIVYRIFMNYAIASGDYGDDFFRQASYRDYIRYVKNITGPDGFTAGYGDGAPLDRVGGWNVLRDAVTLFGDTEAEYLLSELARRPPGSFLRGVLADLAPRRGLPPPGKDTLGLNVFANNAFREKFFKIDGLSKYPTLDKAVFRNSWSRRDGDFVTIDGMNGAPHGHFDAGGISRFQNGENIWLTEGDYILKYPDEHNMAAVNCDAAVEYPASRHVSRSAGVVSAVNNPERSQSLLVLEVPDSANCDKRRIFGYNGKYGMWVVDLLRVRRPGEFVAEVRYRMLGDAALKPDGSVTVKQNNGKSFTISEAAGRSSFLHSQLDAGHEESGNEKGYYANYRFAAPEVRVLTQRFSGKAKTNDTIVFASLLRNGDGDGIAARQAAANVFAGGSTLLFAGDGVWDGIEFAGDAMYVTLEGISVGNCRKLRIDGRTVHDGAPRDINMPLNDRLRAALQRQVAAAKAKNVSPSPRAAVEKKRVFAASVTALAGGADGNFAVGLADGNLLFCDASGKTLWERKSGGGAVTSLAIFPASDGRTYVACGSGGYSGGRPGKGEVALFTAAGEKLWARATSVLQRRGGAVRTLLAANFAGRTAVIAGCESWQYYAFDLAGKQLWRKQVYHGATVGVAADMNGDGSDEIVAGNEYYYHLIFDRNGRELERRTTAPWVFSAVAADLNGDSRSEVLSGRSDGAIYSMAPEKGNGYKTWRTSVGGRVLGIAWDGKSILCVTMPGQAVRLSAAGKQEKFVTLSTPVAAVCRIGGGLAAAGLNGEVYAIDHQCQVRRVGSFVPDDRDGHGVKMVASGQVAVVSSGNSIFIINI